MAVRVLLLTSEYPPYVWGGLGRYSYEVSQELKKYCEVDVLNILTYYTPFTNLESGFDSYEVVTDGKNRVINILNKEMIKLFKEKTISISDDLGIVQNLFEKLTKILNKKYDVIFVQDFYNSLVAVFLLMNNFAKKMVSVCHLPLYAGFTYFDKPVSDEFQQLLESLLIKHSCKVVVPSLFTKRVLIQVYSINPEDIFVIPLGVRFKKVSELGVNENPKREKDKNTINILSVMRFTEQKGLIYVIDVLNELKKRKINFAYNIVGKGLRENDFNSLVSKFSLSPHIRHTKFTKNIFSFYKMSDIYLSVSSYETFGLSVLEAMAYECVPMAFNVGALNELIQNNNSGFLVEVNDTERLVEYIECLSLNPNKLYEMKKSAANYAKNFSWKVHVNKLLEVFRSCLE